MSPVDKTTNKKKYYSPTHPPTLIQQSFRRENQIDNTSCIIFMSSFLSQSSSFITDNSRFRSGASSAVYCRTGGLRCCYWMGSLQNKGFEPRGENNYRRRSKQTENKLFMNVRGECIWWLLCGMVAQCSSLSCECRCVYRTSVWSKSAYQSLLIFI